MVPQLTDGTSISSNDASKLVLDPNNLVTADLDVFTTYLPVFTVALGIRVCIDAGSPALFGFAKGKLSTDPCTAMIKIDGSTSAKLVWCWNGSQWVNTGQSIQNNGSNGYWYDFQIAMNCAMRTYTVVMQESGFMPVLVGTYNWDAGTNVGDSVVFKIGTSGHELRELSLCVL